MGLYFCFDQNNKEMTTARNYLFLPILSNLNKCELYILAADLLDSNSDWLI